MNATFIASGGYVALAVCMCGFLYMLGKLEVNKWIAGKLTGNMDFITRTSMLAITLSFFLAVSFASLTVYDPARMADYLNRILVPLFDNLTKY